MGRVWTTIQMANLAWMRRGLSRGGDLFNFLSFLGNEIRGASQIKEHGREVQAKMDKEYVWA